MVVDPSVMTMLLLLCVTSLMLVLPTEGRVIVLCPPITFYNQELEHCKPCSFCPLNQIITSPCQGVHDTQCGPIKDLQELYDKAAKGRDEFIAQLVHNGTDDGGESQDPVDGDVQLLLASSTDSESTSPEAGDDQPGPEFLDYDWKSLTLFAGVALGFVIVVLLVGIVCIRQKLLRLKNTVDYKLAPPVEL